MITACRQIRRFADACRRKRPARLGQGRFGKKQDPAKHRWKADDCDRLLYYGPLLHLRAQYQLGCRLVERALSMKPRSKGWSFEMLWHVYRPSRPAGIDGVALVHFYSAVGRSLTDWRLWARFVDDLHPKLLRMSGVSRSALKADPALMAPLFRWIRRIAGPDGLARESSRPSGEGEREHPAIRRGPEARRVGAKTRGYVPGIGWVATAAWYEAVAGRP
jgi:hypothetical protein